MAPPIPLLYDHASMKRSENRVGDERKLSVKEARREPIISYNCMKAGVRSLSIPPRAPMRLLRSCEIS